MEINMQILGFASIIFGVTIAAFSQVLLKKSSRKVYKSWIYEYLNPYVIIGYGALLISMLAQIFGLMQLHFSEGAVLEAFGYIIVMILSAIFFQEKITRNKILGMMLILLGMTIYYV